MAAFSAAIDLGYQYLETDVRLTADGVLMAFHDPTLDPTTDGAGAIRDLPYSRVRAARIAGTEPIPLLEDILGSWPKVRINIDAKADETVGPLAAAIRRTAAVDRVCVASFSDTRLARIRRILGPRLCTALGPRELAVLRAVSLLGAAPRHAFEPLRPAAGCAQVPTAVKGLPVVDHRFLRAAHARGWQVHVWTINDTARMRRLLELGVDGIITDATRQLRDVLAGRGQWAARTEGRRSGG